MGTSCRTNVTHSLIKDHPHAYGDKRTQAPIHSGLLGSSPRVWGQDTEYSVCCPSVRIIPTRMGTSKGRGQYVATIRDHPHAYGDKQKNFHGAEERGGSSPRVWGQVNSDGVPVSSDRIIPTRMGTSLPLQKLLYPSKDHPHAYGDKIWQNGTKHQFKGSSPRVWGQAIIVKQKMLACGIIPTRMGTSFYMCSKRQVSRDHPHAYGDKTDYISMTELLIGSSPRVWGQVYYTCRNTIQLGIIPTRMGTSHFIPIFCCICKDHPHAYGDKYREIKVKKGKSGSSPRVWGQARSSNKYNQYLRIIPTRMGTSCFFRAVPTCNEDHPHAYGDKITAIIQECAQRGSSPRVWGQGPQTSLKPISTKDHPHAYGDKYHRL